MIAARFSAAAIFTATAITSGFPQIGKSPVAITTSNSSAKKRNEYLINSRKLGANLIASIRPMMDVSKIWLTCHASSKIVQESARRSVRLNGESQPGCCDVIDYPI